MVHPYSEPEEDLFRESHGTLYVCKKLGEDGLMVIDVKTIQGVVAMIPFPLKVGEEDLKPNLINTFYMAEKPFHDLTEDAIEERLADSDDEEPDD